MDKEQEILQRLKQLREEQHKALKELKKVEKAKKKRRRTAHGYPVFTESGSEKNNRTTVITTPGQANKHVMDTFSKSCSRIDATKNKRKFTPNLKKEQETEKEVVSFSTMSKGPSSNVVDNAARVKVRLLEPHKTEVVVQQEKCPKTSIGLSKRKTNADGIISKPATSLDLTPQMSLFAGKKEDNSSTAVNTGQKSVRRLVKSPRLSRKVRSSLKFPAESNTWRKSESPKSVFGKISRPSEVYSEKKTSTKHDECKRPDYCKYTSKDTLEPQTNENGEEKPDSMSWKEDRKELKIHSTKSNVSSHKQPSNDLSQEFFSQSLFTQVRVDERVPCEDTTLKEVGKDDLSHRCESLTGRKDNSQTDACESGIEATNIKNEEEQHCNEGKGKRINDVKSDVKIDCTETTLIALPHDTDTSSNNTMQPATNPNSPKEKKENRMMNIKGDKLGVREMSSNSCSKNLNTEDQTQEGNLSTMTKESVTFQQVETDMSTVSSSGKMSATIATNDRAGFLGDLDACVFEGTRRQPEKQEDHILSSSIDAAAQNELSELENTLFKDQTERLRPDSIVDMSINFAQSIDISFDKQMVNDADFRTGSQPETVESDARKQANGVSQELKHLESIQDMIKGDSFDELLLSDPLIASQDSPPLPQNVASEEHSSERVSPAVREICLKHSTDVFGSSNVVREIKFLTHEVGETRLDVIVVCFPRLLVLWNAVNMCTWVVLHNWVLDEDEEIFDLDVASIGRCIVLVAGGNFAKALGRVYCVYDKGDCKFDVYHEVSFSDLGEIPYAYKKICLLPNKESSENINIILASAYREKVVLTRWTIDLICFCLEDCNDFPEVIGSELSSLCLVQGSKCLLLGCIDSDVYLWNYNSCEPLCNMTLSSLTKTVCLGAEATSMGMIFLSLLHQEENKVELVAINPQTSRETCLKTLNIGHAVDDGRNKVLCCSKFGANLISSFKHGRILVCNIVTDNKTVLDPKIGDVHCISLHQEDSVIAFGTVSGCVYLNMLSS